MTRQSMVPARSFRGIALFVLLLTLLMPYSQASVGARSQARKASTHVPDLSGAGFELPVFYAAGGSVPWAVAIADLNGDGRPDIVVANWSLNDKSTESDVGVLLANPDGTFAASVSYATGGGQALGVAIADVNGDGNLDIIVANSCLTYTDCTIGGGVTVLLGKGDGTFQAPVNYASGEDSAVGVVVADMNGDGKPDLIVANGFQIGGSSPGSVAVLLGNGDGTFQPAVNDNLPGDQEPVSLAVADLNHDGHQDVVVITGETGTPLIGVLLGNGDGTLQPIVNYGTGGGSDPTAIAIVDLNGDGHPDLVLAQNYGPDNPNDGAVGVLVGNGDGTFQSPVNYDSGGSYALGVAIADVNGDGYVDLIATESGSFSGPGEVGVLLGNGDGTFRAAATFPTGGSRPKGIAVADLNGDGKPDVVVADLNTWSVEVLVNNSGAAATSTSLVSSLNPSVYGQTVTFTATVSSASATPDGSVSFYDGSTLLGTKSLAGGSASMAMSSLATGSHAIGAIYPGSSRFAPSSSSVVSQTVNPATTAAALVSSLNPAGVGQNVTYTATVTAQYGGTITGTITFTDRANKLGTVNLTGNQATYTTLYEAEGSHLIVATYSGDSNDDGSVSPVLKEKIGKAGQKAYPSETTVATSGSPSHAGQPVTFTATVTSAHGPIPDNETVTFYDGRGNQKTEIGTGTTAGGVATFTTTSLAVGAHTINANYVGDQTFKSSKGKVKQVVDK